MAKLRKVYQWKDPQGLARTSIVILWATVVACLLEVGALLALGETRYRQAEEFNGPQFIQWAVGMLSVVLLLASVTLVFWLLRVARNARVFKPSMTTSPLGAVGWYLVPFASLVLPFQAMKDIWNASMLTPGRSPPLLSAWWAAFLINSALAWASAATGRIAPNIVVDIASAVASATLAVISVRLVRRLTDMQVARYALHVFDEPDSARLGGVLEAVAG